MKSKLALLLATLLFFNIILPIQVHAAVIPDISQVTATWDPNIETGWDHVYLEYKSLDPQSRYEADKVIAANAYRFLISIGSKQLEDINQQKFDDFLRAVSPFNIAYNNVLAEQVVHSAWVISGEQYKVFCANVIHNIASNPDYYNTHVIKNDPFVNGAGQQSLQVQYNDIDLNEEINIYNNIFNNNILSSTGSSVGYFFNPLPLNYTGVPITLQGLNVYRDSYNLYDTPIVSSYLTSYDSSEYLYFSNSRYSYVPLTVDIFFDTSSPRSDGSFSMRYDFYNNDGQFPFYTSQRSPFYLLDLSILNYPVNTTSYFNYKSQVYLVENVPFAEVSSNSLDSLLKLYFNRYFYDYVKNGVVYTNYFHVHFIVRTDQGTIKDYYENLIPSESLYYVSPQFQPVNIYNNQYYGSDDDTYFYVDQMVDNIINNDYSTVNNGSNNTFYNDNYYITQPVSGGGIELVTSSSIVYNYITIINNGGGSSSGGSIGSYPYPFDVRIINPDDFKNETETNVTNEILNDNDVNFGDLNFSPSVTVGLNAAKDSIEGIVSVTGSSIVAQFVSGIPPDWLALGFVFLILFIAAGFGMIIIRH